MITNIEAKNEVLAAFEKAEAVRKNRHGSKIATEIKFPDRDGKGFKQMIVGTRYTIINSPEGPVYSPSFSVLREEPAMVRYYGRNGVLVHEELA